MSDDTRNLNAALRYAAKGWPVFPCGRDKKPLTSHGFKDASTDPEQVKSWWQDHPGASIGVPTGTGIGAFVLDVDLPDGPASLDRLEAAHGHLPDTLAQRTGSGGRQLFFLWAEGREVKNSAGKLGPGLDVRGAGGYCIVAPSWNEKGQYQWTRKGAPAEAPAWLLDLIDPPKQTRATPTALPPAPSKGSSQEYGRKALADELAGLASAQPGQRNHALNRSAFSLGQLVGGGALDRAQVETALMGQALALGLSEIEARKTIASGMGGGEQEPRRPEERAGRQGDGKGGSRAGTGPGWFPFVTRTDGVHYLEEDKDGGVSPVWFCSPLRVVALTRDAEGREWGRLLELEDQDGRTHRWAMPMSMLAGNGDGYRSHLMGLGLLVAPGRKGAERLHMFLSLASPEARARCVDRIGWHGRRFVLVDVVYGTEGGSEEIMIQGLTERNMFQASGTLAEWQEHVGRLCVGNSRLVFAVSSALAACLLNLTGQESGGVHFVGGSSLGKTTALHAAGSVCGGGGIGGFIRQWRATDNGLEAVAASHCDSLLCLDEMGQAGGKVAGEVAYMLANGQGKSRAGRDGQARASKQWRVLFLSTGEITLADKIREDGKGKAKAGQAVRVVDIPADAGSGLGAWENLHGHPDGGRFSLAIKEASGRYYGSALRAFLERLTADLDTHVKTVAAFMKDFQARHCPSGAGGQVSRVLGRFALVAAGGELGAALGVLPWTKGEAELGAIACFKAWLARRGGVGAGEVLAGLAQVRAFFEAHGSSRFEDLDARESQRVINRAGYRRKDSDGRTQFMVFPEAFRNEVCAGFDHRAICGQLEKSGVLLPEQGRLTKSVRTPEGRLKLFVLTYDVLSGDSGDSGDTIENTGTKPVPSAHSASGDSGDKAGLGLLSPESCPRCPQSPNPEWGQKNINDVGNVPSVPSVPSGNSQGVNSRPVPGSPDGPSGDLPEPPGHVLEEIPPGNMFPSPKDEVWI